MWAVLALAVVSSGLVIGLSPGLEVNDDPTAGLPASAQSTAVAELQQQLPSGQLDPALVVYSRPGGTLTEADVAAIAAQGADLGPLALDGRVSPPQVSPDRTAALVAVPLSGEVTGKENSTRVADIRAVVRAGLPDGVLAQVTGGAGFSADISAAFDGANLTLLATTASVVALLLVLTYRSPVLWILALAVVGAADQVVASLVGLVSQGSSIPFDESTTGIVSVLVFGAGTDYALLLIARYREELQRTEDRRQAMRDAVTGAGPAIAASGTTVVLALLTLLAAAFGGTRAIGVAGAIGIAVALLFGLVVLPAALVVCPRGLFWPLVPRVGATRGRGRVWRRIGEATARRPWPVIAASVVLLVGLSAGTLTTGYGLSQEDTFRTRAESVEGLQTLSASFPAGVVSPVVVMTTPDRADAMVTATRAVPGVADAGRGESTASLAEVDVVITAEPDTAASYDTVRALRTASATVDPGAVVGGSVATSLDARDASLRDLRVITPLILLVVALVLVALLRALVAPLVLILTVVLSFFAALGAGSLAFTLVFDFPALDYQVPLLAFLFLVALGVDYNIFLVSRAQEESLRHGTRAGVVEALAVTGGVITSAGILLAAVFTVLGVLPVIVLTEIGIIVGLGVLLDTLLVRTVLVPALVHLLGDRFWWPRRLPRHADAPVAAEPAEVTPRRALV
ncbi:putative drug exporter of the RND superfamily [Friedmanniella luteola]|uniref:Putative drug exporter of the RND superfamily n=1 Tax=Friedmanniella luteola TaxID=546871 RepID=A0A1H1MBW1_9ACTN|nr:putative drug exporter of the RND superfamily [Friedmanniella luteola]